MAWPLQTTIFLYKQVLPPTGSGSGCLRSSWRDLSNPQAQEAAFSRSNTQSWRCIRELRHSASTTRMGPTSTAKVFQGGVSPCHIPEPSKVAQSQVAPNPPSLGSTPFSLAPRRPRLAAHRSGTRRASPGGSRR